jgi:predicted DNA-binding transcriptional regulator AlpA
MTQKLLSTAEAARILGVSRWRVSQLANGRADFPRPAVVTRNAAGGVSSRLWRERDIRAWDATADRSPGRRRRVDTDR